MLFIFFDLLHYYRHSLNSIYKGIELKSKVYNTWAKHWKSIELDHNSSIFILFYFLISYILQTLVQLNLGESEIGIKGAQYLSEALQTNTVTWMTNDILCILFSCFTFIIDTNSSLPPVESHWTWRCTIFEQSTTK